MAKIHINAVLDLDDSIFEELNNRFKFRVIKEGNFDGSSITFLLHLQNLLSLDATAPKEMKELSKSINHLALVLGNMVQNTPNLVMNVNQAPMSTRPVNDVATSTYNAEDFSKALDKIVEPTAEFVKPNIAKSSASAQNNLLSAEERRARVKRMTEAPPAANVVG